MNYVIAKHSSGKVELLTEERAFQKWAELKEEFVKYGYIVPADKIYPCIYKVDSFIVNGTASKNPLYCFEREVGTFISFKVKSSAGIETLKVSQLAPLYEVYISEKQSASQKLRKQLEELENNIEQHLTRIDLILSNNDQSF